MNSYFDIDFGQNWTEPLGEEFRNKKILLTNGCSWTWGGGLEPHFDSNERMIQENDRLRQTLVWPHWLGKLRNFDHVVNLSMGCGSNDRIIRITTEWLLNQPDYVIENITAVIQFTNLFRYEYYLPVQDTWVKANPNLVCGTRGNWDFDHKQCNKHRILTWTNDEGFQKAVNVVFGLQGILKNFGIEHYFWAMPHEWNPASSKKLAWLYKQPCWISDNPIKNLVWKTIRSDELEVSSTDMHPNLLGHIKLAEELDKLITIRGL